jgi:hypothetical protein
MIDLDGKMKPFTNGSCGPDDSSDIKKADVGEFGLRTDQVILH